MRKDFDFVEMDDYQHDMREASDTAVFAIRELREDRDFWRAAFWKAVKANGGSVRFYLDSQPGALTEARPIEDGQEIIYYQDDMTTEFRLVAPPTSPALPASSALPQ